jgi:membrane peptidoglycan carboxypeptidase
MYQAGFITKEQYNNALTEQVNIIEVSQQKQMYDMAYFVEYAISDVVTHLLDSAG